MSGRVIVLQGDAARLPLPDASVDLIVTSPPYFGLRSYSDGGEHYAGQIGSEDTPAEYIAALLACTREWMRVLKPEGSIFVNLGDSYHSGKGAPGRTTTDPKNAGRNARRTVRSPLDYGLDLPRKTLLGLPWRYAIACMDELGLILRAEVIWDKPNGLPESVTDRVRRSHEQVFHFTRSPRYYSAVDEIREAHAPATAARYAAGYKVPKRAPGELGLSDRGIFNGEPQSPNPLGKLPGSVWEIPSAPLVVPAHLGVDHFAAYPPELVRRIILGWSPSGICTGCGEGRRPVADRKPMQWRESPTMAGRRGGKSRKPASGTMLAPAETRITGYACACTPYTDHPGTGESSGEGHSRPGEGVNAGRYALNSDGQPRQTSHPGHAGLWDRPKVGPWREYHLEGWDAPATRPAVVLDPFGGTGTSALVASVLGRTGVTVDRSADYCRLAAWRTSDPAERARALGVPKPPPVIDGQGSLFDSLEEAAG